MYIARTTLFLLMEQQQQLLLLLLLQPTVRTVTTSTLLEEPCCCTTLCRRIRHLSQSVSPCAGDPNPKSSKVWPLHYKMMAVTILRRILLLQIVVAPSLSRAIATILSSNKRVCVTTTCCRIFGNASISMPNDGTTSY